MSLVYYGTKIAITVADPIVVAFSCNISEAIMVVARG